MDRKTQHQSLSKSIVDATQEALSAITTGKRKYITSMKLKELVDNLGLIRSIKGDVVTAEDILKAEILKRKKSHATLDESVVIEGVLFRATISFSERELLDLDRIRIDFDKRKLRKYQFTTECYAIRVSAKSGK